MEYTRTELQILWHLKRNSGVVEDEKGIVANIAATLDIREGTVGYILRTLENKCLIVRTLGLNI